MQAEKFAAIWQTMARGLPWPNDELAKIRAREWLRYAAYERRLGRSLSWQETEKLYDRGRRRVSFGTISERFDSSGG